MRRFLLRRLGFLVLSLFVMSAVIFVLTQVLPGNAAKQILGRKATPQSLRVLEERLGLDDPAIVQYGRWVSGILQGDLGDSLAYRRPVSELIGTALMRSAPLVYFTLGLVSVIGVGLGLVAGMRKGSLLDSAIVGTASLGLSVPDFLVGVLLVLIFSSNLGWFPTSGYAPLRDGLSEWGEHLVLPVLTLTILALAHVVRVTRSSVIDSSEANHVSIASAHGLRHRRILRTYVLRNALTPTIAVLAMDVGLLLGEAVIVESVFAYPGFGRLTIFAISQRDLPLLQACALTLVLVFGITSTLADLISAWLNPRTREGILLDAI